MSDKGKFCDSDDLCTRPAVNMESSIRPFVQRSIIRRGL